MYTSNLIMAIRCSTVSPLDHRNVSEWKSIWTPCIYWIMGNWLYLSHSIDSIYQKKHLLSALKLLPYYVFDMIFPISHSHYIPSFHTTMVFPIFHTAIIFHLAIIFPISGMYQLVEIGILPSMGKSPVMHQCQGGILNGNTYIALLEKISFSLFLIWLISAIYWVS